MTDLKQAAQMALEALKSGMAFDKNAAVLQNLRTALEQPEQEPTPWRDMIVVSLVREGINKHRARELADHFAAQPEPTCPECKAAVLYECVACSSNNYPPKTKQEPCIGKDSRCPCQDGDACHYKDCVGTKAWPVAQPEQEPVISAWSLREVYFDEDGEPVMHRSPPAAQRTWVGLTDEDWDKVGDMPDTFDQGVAWAAARLKAKNGY